MQDDVIFTESGRELIAALMLEIDHHTARGLREKIDSRIFMARPELLVLDFSAVRFMDSSGIGLILGRAEAAAEVGAVVKIRGLSPTLCKIVRLSGVDKVKNISILK